MLRGKTVQLMILLLAALLLGGCGMYHRHPLQGAQLDQAQRAFTQRLPRISPELEQRILALNPTNVTAADVRDVLSRAPAPRIINWHGGLARVIPSMASFSEFLIGMGYPAASLTNPTDGTYSFSCYESSDKVAGVVAWFYEKEGLRPMLVGHSQGGFQIVKLLHKFAGRDTERLHVWNPLTWQEEERCEIVDPLTGQTRPLVGLQLPYATTVGTGGATRIMPNQWEMTGRLRAIPDSVEEFTGFCKKMDLLGGDWLGYGPANYFEATGTAAVRNVWLPTEYVHGKVPAAARLLRDPQMVEWINAYRPSSEPVSRPRVDVTFAGDSEPILWAAEVWYSIKKHWVLELQRYVRARPAREAQR